MKEIDLSTTEKRNEIYKIFESFNKKGDIYVFLETTDNKKSISYVNDLAKIIGFDFDYYKEKRNPKKYCIVCNKELKKQQKLFCSNSCSSKHNNKLMSIDSREKRKKTLKEYYLRLKIENTKIDNYTNTDDTKKRCLRCNAKINQNSISCYCNECRIKNKHEKNYKYFLNNPEEFCKPNYTPKNFKHDIINEQNGCCDICGCKELHEGKILIFVLDHIDGDASNNRRKNIRCICPNCDSQTETFKSKNKNSKRRNYWKEKILNSINKQ